MNGDEISNTINNGTVEWSGAGITALVLFVAAWILNKWGREQEWTPVVVMVLSVLGSFVFHASQWSASIGAGMASWMTDNNWPATLVMGIAFGVSMFVIIADLKVDPRVNGWAVTMLFVAPITAHGTSGWIGAIVNFGYESLTALALGLVTNAFGH
jgi:uncharacterized membrane protein (UPF0136 family)